MSLTAISATPEALAALQRITAEHGPVMFHTSGGRVGGRSYPICLPREELRLGARDHLLGHIDGVPIYDMEDREGFDGRSGDFVLDVVLGPSIGFSIDAGAGLRFSLRKIISIDGERSAQSCQPESSQPESSQPESSQPVSDA
ncbi:MAG: DUF779 domain-containing protein [Hyphomicrobium sp.]